ncbi:MAG: hypothetical protein IJJ06_09240 [Mogibacterium sp.]|nr:hypothetical protein [Mogibacterium sp.]
MKYRKNKRGNTYVYLAGLALCIASGFVKAPAGILDDESLSLTGALDRGWLAILFIVPTILVMVSAVLVIIDKGRAFVLVLTAIAAMIYSIMDVGYISSGRTYEGLLMNAFGVILISAGACLHNFGTKDRDIAESELAELNAAVNSRQPYADSNVEKRNSVHRRG